ncbi:MAG: hypothetical protein H6736_17610 [Alphaproteobacteria bacterium]|nr:hypothetical protein [Alphaproteobacteria bacterium]
MSHPSTPSAIIGATHVFWTPTPIREVEDALTIDPFDVKLDETGAFQGTFRRGSTRNSWRPQLRGHVHAVAGGTLVEVQLPMHPLVLAFTALHGMFMLGISWLIGFGAYHFDLVHVRGLLRDTLGATLEGDAALVEAQEHPVADPASPGADTGAPFSLRVRTDREHARFVLKGPDRPRTVAVSAAGVSVARGRPVDWNDLRSVHASPGVLVLDTLAGPVEVPCSGTPEADVRWLVAYLEARNARYSDDPEARARNEAARRQLASVSAARAADRG